MTYIEFTSHLDVAKEYSLEAGYCPSALYHLDNDLRKCYEADKLPRWGNEECYIKQQIGLNFFDLKYRGYTDEQLRVLCKKCWELPIPIGDQIGPED